MFCNGALQDESSRAQQCNGRRAELVPPTAASAVQWDLLYSSICRTVVRLGPPEVASAGTQSASRPPPAQSLPASCCFSTAEIHPMPVPGPPCSISQRQQTGFGRGDCNPASPRVRHCLQHDYIQKDKQQGARTANHALKIPPLRTRRQPNPSLLQPEYLPKPFVCF